MIAQNLWKNFHDFIFKFVNQRFHHNAISVPFSIPLESNKTKTKHEYELSQMPSRILKKACKEAQICDYHTLKNIFQNSIFIIRILRILTIYAHLSHPPWGLPKKTSLNPLQDNIQKYQKKEHTKIAFTVTAFFVISW